MPLSRALPGHGSYLLSGRVVYQALSQLSQSPVAAVSGFGADFVAGRGGGTPFGSVNVAVGADRYSGAKHRASQNTGGSKHRGCGLIVGWPALGQNGHLRAQVGVPA